jgi:hypothetical protein
MKNTFKIFIIILVSLTIHSCASRFPKNRNGIAVDKRAFGEPEFLSQAFESDGDIITIDVPQATDSPVQGGMMALPAREPETKETTQYFSVQVFASKSNSEAKEFKSSIESTFIDEVRIDYQAPYYKVCIGKALGFENGEELLKKVNAMGFSKAWLVKVRK